MFTYLNYANDFHDACYFIYIARSEWFSVRVQGLDDQSPRVCSRFDINREEAVEISPARVQKLVKMELRLYHNISETYSLFESVDS